MDSNYLEANHWCIVQSRTEETKREFLTSHGWRMLVTESPAQFLRHPTRYGFASNIHRILYVKGNKKRHGWLAMMLKDDHDAMTENDKSDLEATLNTLVIPAPSE